MFVPNTDRFPYPEDTAGHYMEVKMDRGIIFNKDYPYIDNSFGFKFKRFWVRLLLRLIVFPEAKIKMGIRVYGKGNLKQYRKQIQNGAITVCNHVHTWDYLCILKAIHNFKWPYLLSWDKNVNGDSGPLVRLVGGIPIPEHDADATIAFDHSVKEMLNKGGWLHIYPEGSMWEYYCPVRPFKLGAASFAVKCEKPIIPMAFTYRKPSWIRRNIFKQLALFDLHIGKPLFLDSSLDKNEQLKDLTIRAHQAVSSLAGLKDNKYPDIYNNSKRIDR